MIEVFFLLWMSVFSFAESSQTLKLAGTVSKNSQLINYEKQFLVIDPTEHLEYKIVVAPTEATRAPASDESSQLVHEKKTLKSSATITIIAP